MKWAFLLILVLACTKTEDQFKRPETSLRQILFHISYAYRVDDFNRQYLNKAGPIMRPAQAWQTLLGLTQKIHPYGGEKKFCLFYRIPGPDPKARPGQLQLAEFPPSTDCAGAIFDSPLRSWQVTINELTLGLVGKEALALDQLFSVPPWTVYLKGFLLGQDKKFLPIKEQAPLYNLRDWPGRIDNRATEWPQYSSGMIAGRYPGLILFPATKLPGPEKKSDPVLLGPGSFCHRLNDSCNELEAYQCHRCPGPWYEVVSNGCAQTYDKVCGSNDCGLKGRPACPRGKKVLPSAGHGEVCKTDSAYGYCSRGLRTYCQDGVLICL